MLDDMVEYGAIVDENRESREAALNVLEVKLRGSITDICRSNCSRTTCWGLQSPRPRVRTSSICQLTRRCDDK